MAWPWIAAVKLFDAVDIDVAVEVPDPTALAARGIDRIGLHEHGGAGVAAGQACQRAVVRFCETEFGSGYMRLPVK